MPTVKTSKVYENTSGIAGRFEPELITQFLPGCPNCQAPHPLARKGSFPADVCPDCGEHLPPLGQSHVERATLGGGVITMFGQLLMSIGRFINNFARKV